MQSQLGRLHFMDSMRGILMMLGVVLHSSQVFNPSQSWLIHSDNSSQLLAYVISIIHIFRMPAFFVVSGYFCFITLRKYKPRKFLKLRLERILIPFFSAALTLNTMQTWLLDYSGFHNFVLTDYLLKGGYLGHLWFLVNLVVYFIFAAAFCSFLKGALERVGGIVEKVFSIVPMVWLVLFMPFSAILILALNKIGFPLYTSFYGIFDTYEIIHYVPYFVFGIVLGLDRQFLSRFATLNPFFSLIIGIGAFWLVRSSQHGSMVLPIIIEQYLKDLSIWFSIAFCFYIFYRFFNYPSKKAFFLSSASYTVYLFHHIFVIGIGLLVIHFKLPPLLGVGVLIISVTSITLLIHRQIITKNRILLYMFNGKLS